MKAYGGAAWYEYNSDNVPVLRRRSRRTERNAAGHGNTVLRVQPLRVCMGFELGSIKGGKVPGEGGCEMIKKSDIPKFIQKKIDKLKELEEKQKLIDMQLQAFCERKGWDLNEFIDVIFDDEENE